ncbi:MAG: rhodanese-like domain-containing protein [Gemmatimonadaceae bacterium]
MPPTDGWAQLSGGVIFGIGFALAALCPGTACVAAASGRSDGVAAVGGILLGTLATPVLWPMLGRVAAVVPREGARLDTDLGVPLSLVVLSIVALGLIASSLARYLNRDLRAHPWWHLERSEVATVTLAVAFLAVDQGPRHQSPAALATIGSEIMKQQDHIDALDLAAAIKGREAGLRVIDVREAMDSETYVIPGAEVVPLSALAGLRVDPSERIVLYSDGGAHAAQGWVLLRARGLRNVFVLKDGMAAWEDEVLSPPFPATADDSAKARFARARELGQWFGGRPRLIARPAPSESTTVRRRRRTC